MTQVKAQYTYKLFRVKRRDGKSTTISLDPVLVLVAIKTLGSAKEVGAMVRDASMQYTKGVDRCSISRFVAHKLMERIATFK